VTELVLVDVNETLIDLEPLRERFEQVGVPGHRLETWFAATLRDGIALAAAGSSAPFRAVAHGVLRGMLAEHGADHVLAGMAELPLQPDVTAGLRALRDAGLRVATLTNGSAETAAGALERAGVGELVEHNLSVDDLGRWKPAPEAYLRACAALDLAAEDAALVSAHPWDVHGARRAGLLGVWLNRGGAPWPEAFAEPDTGASQLAGVAPALAARVTT
jgi:2-haloacid dehalogenase